MATSSTPTAGPWKWTIYALQWKKREDSYCSDRKSSRIHLLQRDSKPLSGLMRKNWRYLSSEKSSEKRSSIEIRETTISIIWIWSCFRSKRHRPRRSGASVSLKLSFRRDHWDSNSWEQVRSMALICLESELGLNWRWGRNSSSHHRRTSWLLSRSTTIWTRVTKKAPSGRRKRRKTGSDTCNRSLFMDSVKSNPLTCRRIKRLLLHPFSFICGNNAVQFRIRCRCFGAFLIYSWNPAVL